MEGLRAQKSGLPTPSFLQQCVRYMSKPSWMTLLSPKIITEPDNIIWNKKTSQLDLFTHGVGERKKKKGIFLSNQDFYRKQTERAAQFQTWTFFFF